MPSINRVPETWIFADRSLRLERRWRNSESGKPPQFFKKNWGAVWGMCETLCLFRPDSGKAVLSSGTVAIDQLQPVALADELVKGCLVICGSQAMPSLPGRGVGNLAKDCCVSDLRAVAVAADYDRLVTLTCYIVEERLVLIGCQTMAGLPGRGAGFLAPDGGVEVLAAVEVAADPVERVALARELVESGLILLRGQTMA